MSFLPIVVRELRSQSRRKGQHWSRWSVALIAVMFSLLAMLSDSAPGSALSVGAYAYRFLMVIAVAIAGSAVLATADSLSGERREGTLGFLFLTNLGGHDVVLGKLATHGLVILYALLALLPATALPILSGGVTLGQVSCAALACLNLLFVALNLGLWISTKPQTQFVAMRRAVLILMGLLWLPKLIAYWSPAFLSGKFSLAMLSPLECLRLSEAAAYSITPTHYWNALWVSHLTGWTFLVLAVWSIRRNWRKPGEDYSSNAKMSFPWAKSGKCPGMRPPRRLLEIGDPVYWRASRLPGQRFLLWVAAVVGGVSSLWGITYLLFGFGIRPFMAWGYLNGLTTVCSLLSAFLFAWGAGRFFHEARRSGELELLLCTPIGARQIISGQWAGFWRLLRWPLALLALCGLLPSLFSYARSGPAFGGTYFTVSVLLRSVLYMANLILGVVTVSWVGMWLGLRGRNLVGSATRTVLVVKVLPWLVSMLFSIAATMGGMRLGGTGNGLPYGFIVFYFTPQAFTLLAYLYFIRWARRRLHQELVPGMDGRAGYTWRGNVAALQTNIRRARHWNPSA